MSLVSLKVEAITEMRSTFFVEKFLTEKLNTYKFFMAFSPFLFPYLIYIYIIPQNYKNVNNDFIGYGAPTWI